MAATEKLQLPHFPLAKSCTSFKAQFQRHHCREASRPRADTCTLPSLGLPQTPTCADTAKQPHRVAASEAAGPVVPCSPREHRPHVPPSPVLFTSQPTAGGAVSLASPSADEWGYSAEELFWGLCLPWGWGGVGCLPPTTVTLGPSAISSPHHCLHCQVSLFFWHWAVSMATFSILSGETE